MNNPVEEAIGGYLTQEEREEAQVGLNGIYTTFMNVLEENEIAANSRLRRDDGIQHGLAHDAVLLACMNVGDADNYTAHNQTTVRKVSEATSPTDQALIEGLARVITEESIINGEHRIIANPIATARHALLYMQQHVRPLVEALEDAVIATASDHAEDPWSLRARKALSSLPPVLRGGE